MSPGFGCEIRRSLNAGYANSRSSSGEQRNRCYCDSFGR